MGLIDYYRARVAELQKEKEILLFALEKATEEKKSFVEFIAVKIGEVVKELKFCMEQLEKAIQG